MKNAFFCEPCQKPFQATGEKEEWLDAVFGPTWKLIAYCPNCEAVSNEFKDKLQNRSSSSTKEPAPSACATGACPYIN